MIVTDSNGSMGDNRTSVYILLCRPQCQLFANRLAD